MKLPKRFSKIIHKKLLQWRKYINSSSLIQKGLSLTFRQAEAVAIYKSGCFNPSFLFALSQMQDKDLFADQFEEFLYLLAVKGKLAGKGDEYIEFSQDLIELISELREIVKHDAAKRLDDVRRKTQIVEKK